MPVVAREVQQRIAVANRNMHHLADENIVIAHRDDFVDRALDGGQNAGQQRDPGDARVPVQPIETVVPLAREAVREVLLFICLKH